MIILQTYNKDYEVTIEQVEKIREQSTLGKLGGFWLEGDYVAFSQIKDIQEIRKEQNHYPKLPSGYKVISPEKRNEILLRGLRRVKPEATLEDVKNFMKPKPKTYNPKYKTWEEAKAAGVV